MSQSRTFGWKGATALALFSGSALALFLYKVEGVSLTNAVATGLAGAAGAALGCLAMNHLEAKARTGKDP